MKNHTENEASHAGDAPGSADKAAASNPVDALPRTVPPRKRLAGAFLAGIPFFCTLPYTIHSWRSSPMDRWNWIFHLAFLALAACGAPAMRDSAKKDRCDLFALPAVAAAAVLYAAGVVRQIYMIRILGGMAFWWTGVWFFCGWPGAWVSLPAFGALSLGCTSSTFVLCNRFPVLQPQTVLYLKLGAVVLCAAVCAILMLADFVMKREVFWFLLAAATILAGTFLSRDGVQTAPPFRPDLSAAPEGFTNTEIPLTPDLIRFFEGSEAHQYRIADNIFQCSVLVVKCGNDIHKIHPVSHCLRSGGAVIRSESVVMHSLSDGRTLPVTEIYSTRADGTPALTFAWYTGPDETLGSFFRFRSEWSSSDRWYSYQITTRIYDGNDEAARKFLLDVLSKF